MNFKQTINEEQEILLEYTKHNISELIASGSIPLAAGMMDRLGFLEKDQLAYHVTNFEYLKELASNQHKKKQISCFTKGGPELLRLPSQPNILMMLKGTTVIKGKTDIWTLVSTRDRRWLDINPKGYAGAKADKLLFLVQGVLNSVAKRADIFVDAYGDSSLIKQTIDNLPGKQKIILYKSYLQEMENMLNKHYKVLIAYINDAAEWDYNEVILTRWEIMDVWCIEYDDNVTTHLLNKLNLPFAGVMSKRDLKDLKI